MRIFVSHEPRLFACCRTIETFVGNLEQERLVYTNGKNLLGKTDMDRGYTVRV
jgi:hypothetical protein